MITALQKTYSLPLSEDLQLLLVVNIGWTLGVWLRSSRDVKEKLYVDGTIYLVTQDGEELLVAGEQDMGSLLDFLEAPAMLEERFEGLLMEGLFSAKCELTVEKNYEGYSSLIFKTARYPESPFVVRISEQLKQAFAEANTKVVADLELMFEKDNLPLISRLAL